MFLHIRMCSQDSNTPPNASGVCVMLFSMTIREILEQTTPRLAPRRITCAADKGLGALEAEILLAHALKKDRAWLFAHSGDTVPAPVLRRFRAVVARRIKHEPIAYIVGTKEFYGLPFGVDRRVLIPRPESELLVDLAREASFPEPSHRDLVWDVGTGSGAIAIAIAKHVAPRHVLATDVSPAALALAKKNAGRAGIRNVTFLRADLLDRNVRRFLEHRRPSRLVIVGNLPYLPVGDRRHLAPDVVTYEPADALFAGKHGTERIETFLRQLAAFDVHFGSVFLEFDPPQSKKLRALAKKLFPRAVVRIRKDLAKRNRVLEITRVPG